MRRIHAPAVVLAAFLMSGCGRSNEPPPPESGSAAGTVQPGAQQAGAVQAVAPQQVFGIGRIEPELRMVALSSEVSGTVRAIETAAGDSARAGAVIVRMSDAIERAQLAQAEARIGTESARLQAAQALLRAARARAGLAALPLARTESLLVRSVEAEAVLDAARADDAVARAEVDRLLAETEAARGAGRQAEADRQLAQAELERRAIRAPADGVLLSLDLAVGDHVAASAPFGVFAIASPLTAWCEVDELFADRVARGQSAVVRYPGTTAELARGTVVFVGPYLRRKSLFADDVGDLEDRRVREVRIRLAPDAALLHGARVECVIRTN